MEHFFELPIKYRGEELLLKTRLVTFAYTYKFHIIVDNKELIVERDEERNFRVIASDNVSAASIDPELVKNIVEQLQLLNS